MFANRVKKLRQRAQLTQQQLADELNITQAAITRYERGVQEPTRDVLIKMADFFNCSVDYLIGRTSKPGLEIREERDLPEEIRGIGIENVEIKKGADLSPEDVAILKEFAVSLRRLGLLKLNTDDGNK